MSALPVSCSSFSLRVCLDATELAAPVLGEHPAPVVHRPKRVCVGSIQGPPPVAPDGDKADIQEHLKVLRDRGLLECERIGDLAHGSLFGGNEFKNVATTRFSDRVERVGGRRGARHPSSYIFLYGNMSSCPAEAGHDDEVA